LNAVTKTSISRETSVSSRIVSEALWDALGFGVSIHYLLFGFLVSPVIKLQFISDALKFFSFFN